MNSLIVLQGAETAVLRRGRQTLAHAGPPVRGEKWEPAERERICASCTAPPLGLIGKALEVQSEDFWLESSRGVYPATQSPAPGVLFLGSRPLASIGRVPTEKMERYPKPHFSLARPPVIRARHCAARRMHLRAKKSERPQLDPMSRHWLVRHACCMPSAGGARRSLEKGQTKNGGGVGG